MPITIDTEFCEHTQNLEGKNQLASDLNVLLGRAQYFRETSDDESDREAEKATLAVANRLHDIFDLKLKGRPAERPTKMLSGRKLVL